MAKVFAPNKQYNGISAGVTFVNGVGETTDPYLLSWFKDKGYQVEENKESENIDESEETTKRSSRKKSE